MELLLILIIIALLLYAIYQKKLVKSEEGKNAEPSNVQLYPYSKKHLLSKTEYTFYQILKTECDKNNLLICPKVRLEDFISVTDKQNYTKYRGYIKSRHIDFLLCNSKLQIIGAIELDDNSHNQAKAQKTDDFKNNLFKTIEIPLYRVKTSDSSYIDKINEIISVLTPQNK